ncbi:hypothetical protein [Petroclostridium sp. X23]|uniref:hypothetical protein n=1 Tax=Petroclostridium sp. X23 TaxID=3045146 RepID=UPI0024ACC520|nr:hypothetical protein [Petroclostridium sp. X23]WHH59286.1 hypothetical protein QKW49_00510 [Petroclostridium sp. X23]
MELSQKTKFEAVIFENCETTKKFVKDSLSLFEIEVCDYTSGHIKEKGDIAVKQADVVIANIDDQILSNYVNPSLLKPLADKVILISEYNSMDKIQQAKSLGYKYFLRKPVNEEQLIDQLVHVFTDKLDLDICEMHKDFHLKKNQDEAV